MGPFVSSLLIALFVGLIFSYAFERDRGAFGFFWVFLLVFFPLWLAALWIEPVGPIFWGVAWLEMLLLAIVLALLIAAATPANYYRRNRLPPEETKRSLPNSQQESLMRGATAFFWAFMIVVFFLIIASYMIERSPRIAH